MQFSGGAAIYVDPPAIAASLIVLLLLLALSGNRILGLELLFGWVAAAEGGAAGWGRWETAWGKEGGEGSARLVPLGEAEHMQGSLRGCLPQACSPANSIHPCTPHSPHAASGCARCKSSGSRSGEKK